MTVYTDGPIDSALFQNNPAPGGFGGIGGGMRNPTPYFPRRVGGLSGFFGGLAGGRMANPPRRMPGGPSKGGNTTPPPIQGPMRGPQMPRPPMQRPGGPGKGRPRGGLMRRGRGRPMPGGPGKGRGRPQMPMPQQPFMGRVGNNMPQPPFMGRVGNNMPQEPRMTTFMPTRNMEFPQPTARPNQTMGRPMPQPSGFDRRFLTSSAQPDNVSGYLDFYKPLQPQGEMGFYGGGITDLY